jgi:hypothetical protein
MKHFYSVSVFILGILVAKCTALLDKDASVEGETVRHVKNNDFFVID